MTQNVFQVDGGRWVWTGTQYPDGSSGPRGFATAELAEQACTLLIGVFVKTKREQTAVFAAVEALREM